MADSPVAAAANGIAPDEEKVQTNEDDDDFPDKEKVQVSRTLKYLSVLLS